MVKYIAFFAGLMLMTIPDDASMLQFTLQGLAGLSLTLSGIAAMLWEQEDR
jgi:hypothetical protein